MNIRSVTYFANAGFPLERHRMKSAGSFLLEARQAFEAKDLAVQTTRLALPPFGSVKDITPENVVQYALDVEAAAFVQEIEFAAIGPARLGDSPAHYEIIPKVLGATETIFTAAEIASPLHGVDLAAIKRVSEIVLSNAQISPNGFGNLRFAALANVEPGAPFLPAAYHGGGSPTFAIATEAADLAVDAFTSATSLAEARTNLIAAIEDAAGQIQAVAKKIGSRRSLRFTGIDFSLAPFPEQTRSIGAALEALGAPAVGMQGTLAAAAFVADTLDRAQFPHTGFSGLFLPLLEDSVLAQRSADGVLTINDLLLYSAVCGTGLDTIPLAGDTDAAEVEAILLDVAALALRLNKPLTARLMPIPGKAAGDPITFDFPYFADGRVLAHKAQPLSGPLGGSEHFELAQRGSR